MVTGPKFLRTIAALGRSDGGNTAIFAAMMVTGVAGAAGLATDVGYWYAEKTHLQSVADAAATAAAGELAEPGHTAAQAIAAAMDSAASNGYSAAAGATVNVAVSGDGKTATATIASTGPRFFSKLFLDAGPTITASASAGVIRTIDNPVCFYALNKTISGAVNVGGNSTIYMPDCGMQVNSSSATAVTLNSGSTITDAYTCVTGGVSAAPSAITPAPATGCGRKPDPLAARTPPSYGACSYMNYSVNGNSVVTLNPGVYCGGITLNGGAIVTFNPGVYVLKDGPFRVAGGAAISGSGVGFYLTGRDNYADFTGSSGVALKAASTGSMAGIVLWGAASTQEKQTGSKLVTGGTAFYYEGTIYFPTKQIALTGSTTTTTKSKWAVMIADTFVVSGNTAFNADYTNSDVPLPTELFTKVVLTN